MTIRVIGAGFGRTGTASLKLALETLGFDKCYHMTEVFKHRADAKVWLAAGLGEAVEWNTLFAGYQATVDWPGCTFYRELMVQYPEAKVILTVRDPEKWYASALQTIYTIATAPPAKVMRRVIPSMRTLFRMQEALFWNGTFHGRFADKAYAMEVFQRHNEEVQRVVPPERLLVYEVTQGWEPLCHFLDVPVPQDQPFPHVNDTAEFRRRLVAMNRIMRRAVGAAVLLPLLGGAIVAGRSVRARRRRAGSVL